MRLFKHFLVFLFVAILPCAASAAAPKYLAVVIQETPASPPPEHSSEFAKVALGVSSSCAITATGGVKCWGSAGRIGDGALVNRCTPVQVVGLTSGVTSLVNDGISTNCAVQNGGVKCWGANLYGEVGDGAAPVGASVYRTSPVQVVGLTSGVTQLVGSNRVFCALQNGGVKCWGQNGYYQAGSGGAKTTPNPILGLSSGVTQLAMGGFFVCALQNGGVKCWGDGRNGQMGNDTAIPSNATPITPTGLSSGVTYIAAGEHSVCAIQSGALKCWGENGIYGKLGNGAATPYVDIPALTISSGVTDVQLSTNHGCAVQNGAVKCWGANMYGQVGDGTTATKYNPTQVSGLTSGAKMVSLGATSSCALMSGSLRCWGQGTTTIPLPGNGSTANALLPVMPTGMTAVTQVYAGSYTRGVINNDKLYLWGYNTGCLLGFGHQNPVLAPTWISVD